MGFDGNWGELDQAVARIQKFKDAGPKVAKAAAGRIRTLFEQQFVKGVTPDGAPWAPKKDGSRATLFASGEMYNSLQVYAEGSAIRATMSGPAAFHQSGTSRMPQRQLLPTWNGPSEEYQQAVREAAEEVLGEKAE